MSVVEVALTAEQLAAAYAQLSDEERRSFLEAACADRLRGRLQAFPHQARLDEGIDGISDGAPKEPCFEGFLTTYLDPCILPATRETALRQSQENTSCSPRRPP